MPKKITTEQVRALERTLKRSGRRLPAKGQCVEIVKPGGKYARGSAEVCNVGSVGGVRQFLLFGKNRKGSFYSGLGLRGGDDVAFYSVETPRGKGLFSGMASAATARDFAQRGADRGGKPVVLNIGGKKITFKPRK